MRIQLYTGENMTITAFAALIASRLLAHTLIVLVPLRIVGPFFGPVCSALVLLLNHPIDLGLLACFRRFGILAGTDRRTLPRWLLCHVCGRTQQIAHKHNEDGLSTKEADDLGWSADDAGTRCPFCTQRNL